MGINAADLISDAKTQLGVQYVWGGTAWGKGMDCSGFMQQLYGRKGIKIPRVTYDQWNVGKAVSMKGLRPGDMVFFDTNHSVPGPDHVGMYIGGGKMIEAPRPGKPITITDITKGYFADRFMGGRRINGVWAEGANPGDEADTRKLPSPEELASSYGYNYAFLEGNPELKKIFGKAVKETWTEAKFQAEVRDTKWFKSNSETMRQAEVTRKTDPATWDAMVSAETIKIRQLAAEIGAAIPESRMKKVVETALRTGQDEDSLRNTLGAYVTFTKNGTLAGEAGMHEFTMKQYAAKMGITLSDQAIKNQAQRVVRKVATTQDYESLVREQAKSMYPGYSQQIDAGETMQDIAGPYMQMMAQTLELPDIDITLSDPLIKSALNGLNAEGKPAGLTLTQFQDRLKGDPRYNKTIQARDNAMNVSSAVLKDMGLIGGG